jgi:tetratricopeptide (TPR) repeat protein
MFDRDINNLKLPPTPAPTQKSPAAASKLKNAIAYESTGKYESALFAIEEALSLQGDYSDAWLIKGIIYCKLGKCNDALKCYDKLIQLDPNSAEGWRLKAATYSSMKLEENAVDCLSKALIIEPQNLEFRLSLAVAYQRLKKFEDALRVYEETKRQLPNEPRIDYYIGLMWGNNSDNQKALSAFEDSLKLNPDFTEALLAKGIILSRLNRKEEAKECADKILQLKGASTSSEKQPAPQAQSLNDSIRSDFNASQRRFTNKYSPKSN